MQFYGSLIFQKEALLRQLCYRLLYINSANHTLTLYSCGYKTFQSTHEAYIDHAVKAMEVCITEVYESQVASARKEYEKITAQDTDKRFIKGKSKEANLKSDESAASKHK